MQSAGFTSIRSRDVSYVLMEMMKRIQRRLDRLDDLAASDPLGEVSGLRDAGPRLAAAREFVTSGGVGYALFTARNPRDRAS